MTAQKPKPSKNTLRTLRNTRAAWRNLVMFDTRLSPFERVTLWHLAEYITMDVTALRFDDSGKIIINPGQAELNEKIGVHRNTITATIKIAVHLGYLKRVRKGNGFLGTSKYRLLPLKERPNPHLKRPRKELLW